MNIERGFARAIKALNQLSVLCIGLCLLKIIQYFPTDADFLHQRSSYWNAVKETCPKTWDCYSMVMWGMMKDLLSFFSPVTEWILIGATFLFVIEKLIHILRGFLDDEGIFFDE
jgi:hypothetical protein